MKSSIPLAAVDDTELVLEALFRHAPVGVFLLDLHRAIVDANDAFCDHSLHPVS